MMTQPTRSVSHTSRFRNSLACKWLLLLPLLGGLFPLGDRLHIGSLTEPAQLLSAEAIPDPQQLGHVFRLGVKPWHERGQRGRGMKVAIIDSGFRGYRSYLGKGLPAQVQVRSFRHDENLEARASQHGILCGEVIHAVAPEAEVLFANWEPNRPDTFLDAVRWARRQGAQLVSCSCIMPDWSDGEGGGAVHEELARILGTGKEEGDLLFFGCVGNTARRHWRGMFQPDSDGFHQWSQGQEENLLTPWGDEQVAVELYCRPGTTYEVSVHDEADGALIVRSSSACEGDRCTAAARFQPESGHRYVVRVRATQGKPGQFHLVALHSDLETSLPDGSICFPGDGRFVIGVGAVDQKGVRQSYSACGPNSGRPKPDIVAPVPFASRCRSKPFSGTSAATPQAAGLAAVLWSGHSDWSADRVRKTLLDSARDLGPPGHDHQTGYGLINLATPR